jgi:hypothetical protein
MMIGYPKNTKGYKLWDLNLQKVVISRYVLFEEVRQSNEICKQESKSENENIRKTPSSEGVDDDGDDDERVDQHEGPNDFSELDDVPPFLNEDCDASIEPC